MVALVKNRLHPLAEAPPLSSRMNQRRDCCIVLLAQLVENHCDRIAIPCFRLRGSLDQFVGNAAHCGDDHHDVTFARSFPNDFDDFLDAGGIGHRCPAKFHYAKWFLSRPIGPSAVQRAVNRLFLKDTRPLRNGGTYIERRVAAVRTAYGLLSQGRNPYLTVSHVFFDPRAPVPVESRPDNHMSPSSTTQSNCQTM